MTPRIVAAALLTPKGLPVMLPAPARHHDVVQAMRDANMTRETIANSEQGFITSDGRFVSREEAFAIAVVACQLKECSVEGVLYSEDVW